MHRMRCCIAPGVGAYWVGNPFITMYQLQYPSKAPQMTVAVVRVIL